MAEENDSKETLTFSPPKDWAPPESENKKEFDIVCTFAIEDDGRLTLTKLGDTSMDEKETDDKKPQVTAPDTKPGYGEYAKGVMGGMGGGGMGGMGSQ